MFRLLKWLILGVLVYLVWAMLTTRTDEEPPSHASFVDLMIEHTDDLKDSQGNDPLAARVKDNSVDTWLSANLERTGALVLKRAGDDPDTTACRSALKYFKSAALLGSLDPSAEQLLAWVLWRLGDTRLALVAGERALELASDKDTTTALAWLGSLYLQTGQVDSALSCFRRQLALGPNNELYYNDTRYYLNRSGLPSDTLEAVLATSRVHTGLMKRARRAYREYITWPRRRLAELYHSRG